MRATKEEGVPVIMKKFDTAIPEIEEKIAYSFKDKSLLRQAFTRTSFCNEMSLRPALQSNEVLEFFGDSALSLAIVTYLIKSRCQRYVYGLKTDLGEGDFSNIRSKLSDKKNLSENIKRLGLEKHLLMGEGDGKLQIQKERSVMEDLFESIIGAIWVDSDSSVDAVMKSVEVMLDLSVYLDKKSGPVMQSYKNLLQEWCADKSRRLPQPKYAKLSESGPDHNKLYTVVCYVGEELLGHGEARSIKQAEAMAAEEAYRRLSKAKD